MDTMSIARLRRKLRAPSFQLRQARVVAKAMQSRGHPIVAHIVPIRRCNLSCTYCNEFDDFSKPVPTPVMLRRIDRLAELGTSVITISGGEPLLHPELDQLIQRIRSRGSIATLITNGYLLTPERIQLLNRAGLDHLQISIDNVRPDEVSKKSLKVLDKKLQWLAEHAEFQVNINSVIGTSEHPEDAAAVARRARTLGFATTVGIIFMMAKASSDRWVSGSSRSTSTRSCKPEASRFRRSHTTPSFRRISFAVLRTTGAAAQEADISTFAKTG